MKPQSSKVNNNKLLQQLLYILNLNWRICFAGDIQSRTGRQYGMMPAIDPHLLAAALHDFFMNYQQPQQQTPSNTFSGWVSSPSSNIPIINSDSSQSTFDDDDETLLTSRQQQQFPCGRGPAALPQRQIVGIVGGTEAKKNSWPFIVSCSNFFLIWRMIDTFFVSHRWPLEETMAVLVAVDL